LEASVAKKWASTNSKEADLEQLVKDEDFKKEFYADILKLAAENKFSTLEKPKQFLLLKD